jgi:CDP-diacylglycerol--inositol 3-phosphatidyltransferase
MTYTKIFYYIPNIIGYLRIVCTLCSIYWAFNEKYWYYTLQYYMISFILDGVDGFCARLFNQCTKFGSLLDMITDRCSTLSLLIILSHLYHQKYITMSIIFIISLDISSHWLHMMSSKNHHKIIDKNQNIVVKTYYNNKLFFSYCCIGTEFTYILFFVLYYKPNLVLFKVLPLDYILYLTGPACGIKNVINVYQLLSACVDIAIEDVKNEKFE